MRRPSQHRGHLDRHDVLRGARKPGTVGNRRDDRAELRDGSGETRIARVRALASAGPGDVTFFENRRYRNQLKLTRAAACFIHQRDVQQLPQGVAALIAPQPYRAFVRWAASISGIGQAGRAVWRDRRFACRACASRRTA